MNDIFKKIFFWLLFFFSIMFILALFKYSYGKINMVLYLATNLICILYVVLLIDKIVKHFENDENDLQE
jgi:Ca2+/Na+ antiporter